MPSHLSSNSRSNRASRARLSDADLNAQSVYDAATQLSSSFSSRLGRSSSASTEDFFSQFWTPGLLDRLQTPLTRYRE
jgi:hypothetical protein